MIIDPSWSALVALMSGPLIGLTVLVVQGLLAANRFALVAKSLRENLGAVACLLVADACASALCVVAVLVFGATRFSTVANGFEHAPVLAWAIVGVGGPIATATAAQRLQLGALTEFLTRQTVQPQGRRIASPVPRTLGDLRDRWIGQIVDAAWENRRTEVTLEGDALEARAIRLCREGWLAYDDLMQELSRYAALREHSNEEIAELLSRHARLTPTHKLADDVAVGVIGVMVDQQYFSPLRVACRRAESRCGAADVPAKE